VNSLLINKQGLTT